MERTSETACWSCGQTGEVIAGKSWLRRCRSCDVEWNARPVTAQVVHDREFERGRQLDKTAAKFGLGNREAFVEHVPGELASPA